MEKQIRVGAQYYNLWRTPLEPKAKLQVIRTLGYDSVELAGFNGENYDGPPASELKKCADELGLAICGAHVPYPKFADSMEQIISCHKELGVHWIAIPRPRVESARDMEELIDHINRYAARLRAAGLDLYYHCHDFEFRALEGVTAMERILKETDVMLEVDVFWAARGGCDVPSFIREHRERIRYLHLKDSVNGKPCAIGQGELDWSYYYDAAAAMGHTDIVVEDDIQEPDGVTSICNSMQCIRKYRGW